QKIDPGVRSVAAEFRHFVETDGTLSGAERQRLERLLAYGTASRDAAGELYLVVPRVGTLSPWSSKATDIARNCGLVKVKRIERGTAYFVRGASKDLSAPLHDRMTQTVLRSFDAAGKLFEHVPPRPLVFIKDIQRANRELGLALTEDEIEYLEKAYQSMG